MYPKKKSQRLQLRIKISQIANRMLGSRYELGSWQTKGATYDCFSYWYHFFKELGVDLPDNFGKFNLSNYDAEYKKNPKMSKKQLIAFIQTLGQPLTNINFFRPGDLCLFYCFESMNKHSADNKNLAFAKELEIDPKEIDPEKVHSAIYIGNGNFLTCDQRVGIILFPRSRLSSKILEVRRLCKPCRI